MNTDRHKLDLQGTLDRLATKGTCSQTDVHQANYVYSKLLTKVTSAYIESGAKVTGLNNNKTRTPQPTVRANPKKMDAILFRCPGSRDVRLLHSN